MSIFGSVKMKKPRLSKFNLSHERKFSMKMGDLVPIMCQEVVPGDKFRVNTELLVRLAPMLAPMMHRVDIWTHYFFVPNRLLWSEWENFITGGTDGTAAPVAPVIDFSGGINNLTEGSLSDYLGLPPSLAGTPTIATAISALPFRAYATIWNEYFRDQTLSGIIAVQKSSGVINQVERDEICALRKRCWEKDYFTAALPWTQRGPEASMAVDFNLREPAIVSPVSGGTWDGGSNPTSVDGGNTLNALKGASPTTAVIDAIEDGSITVNELRRSIKLQEWLEKNARGGARYIEQILAHFGVLSSDARLQRPEYLGGGRVPVSVSEVLATYQRIEDATSLPQGNMSGHGISAGTRNGFKRGFEEHGFVMGVCSILPKTAYQQGVSRMFTRPDKLDYYWPEFANLGEQPVYTKELYYDWTAAVPTDEVFGYNPRYSEYKFIPSSVHGAFRSSLAYWHMGRIFSGKPALNASFVTADPTSRVFAVELQDVENVYVQLYHDFSALRPMPYFGTPRL